MPAEVAPAYDYLRNPEAITKRSFEIVEGLVDLGQFRAQDHAMVLRLVHACGMPDIAADLVIWGDLQTAAMNASVIFVDSHMLEAGITRTPDHVQVRCTLRDPAVAQLAREMGTTRSAAAVELWRDNLENGVVAIGNAPTALFHLLERLRERRMKPLAILGFPVGFVGAAESKEALIEADLGIPFVTLRGRRGGSAMAAAALNALFAERARPQP